jgi:hypothetical protein
MMLIFSIRGKKYFIQKSSQEIDNITKNELFYIKNKQKETDIDA